MHPRLREFWKQRLEAASRPRKQLTVTFDDTTPDTGLRIRHHVPHIPDGWTLLSQDRAGSVYQTQAPDKHYLYLAADVVSMVAKIEVG
jgi:hypothetical protein